MHISLQIQSKYSLKEYQWFLIFVCNDMMLTVLYRVKYFVWATQLCKGFGELYKNNYKCRSVITSTQNLFIDRKAIIDVRT